MTTYTNPHNMPILETTDKIAASDDGLRQDINNVSTAAAAAITAEGGRAETAAKDYTDSVVGPAVGALDDRLEVVEGFTPKVAADDPKYRHVVLDQADRLLAGEESDGTTHIPHLRTDRHTIGPGESTTYVDNVDGYRRALLTSDDRLLSGERYDGTIHIPHLEVSLMNGKPAAGAPDYRIVIVAGQSNSIFRFNTDGPKLAEPDPRIKWWNRLTGTMTDLSPNVTPSIASAFAREYLKENPGVTLLIVPRTVGSTGFRTSSIEPPPAGYLASTGTWDRTLTADPANLALELFAALAGARAATGNAPVVAMLWSQGESDRTRMTETEYAAAIDDLVGKVRTDVAQADMPVIVTSFTPEEIKAPQYSGTEGIIKALEGIQSRLFNTAYHYGPENMITYGEQIHWNPEGNRVRGSAMARETLRRARLNVSGSLPQSPTNPRASRAGNDVTIQWDYPYARTTGFALETSPDGITWTAQALDRPYATKHTIASAAPIRARITAANETGTSYATMEVTA